MERRIVGSGFYRARGEWRANKIFIGIQKCTYNLRRGKKGNGFGDFWEVKWGLTGCGIGNRCGSARLALKTGARTGALGSVIPKLGK